jgi:hypothetical protein
LLFGIHKLSILRKLKPELWSETGNDDESENFVQCVTDKCCNFLLSSRSHCLRKKLTLKAKQGEVRINAQQREQERGEGKSGKSW